MEQITAQIMTSSQFKVTEIIFYTHIWEQRMFEGLKKGGSISAMKTPIINTMGKPRWIN